MTKINKSEFITQEKKKKKFLSINNVVIPQIQNLSTWVL